MRGVRSQYKYNISTIQVQYKYNTSTIQVQYKLQYKYNTSTIQVGVQVGYKLYRDGELGSVEDAVQFIDVVWHNFFWFLGFVLMI